MPESSPHPYRRGLATGAGVVLLAGLVIALADLIHTGLRSEGGVGFIPALLGLWALIVLPMAVAVGIVLGAGNATWGTGWVRGVFRKLCDDPQLDRAVSALLIAASVLGGVLALGVSKLAMGLVANVERKSVGALLLGVVVVGLVPILALGALPLYRVTRVLTGAVLKVDGLWQVLRKARISLTVLYILGVVAMIAAAGAFVIFRKLDYQALSLGSLLAPAMLPVVAIVIAVLAYGPLTKLRERIPARGAIVAGGALLALALPLIALRGPSETTRTGITEGSYIGARMVGILRKTFDSDKDGYSAFFGGPDCNDSNAAVNPAGKEVPGNGIDDNCVGGDAKVETAAPADAGAGSGSGSGSATPPTPAAPTVSGGKNLLVIFVDTLRYDRLGIAGYQRDGKSLTPRIDAFAKESVVFSKAFAQAPNTPRSVPSFLGSRYPSQLKVDKVKKGYPQVLDDNVLLFEALKPAGFTTLGSSSHFYFCDRKKYPDTCSDVTVNSNITQGSDSWDNQGALSISGSNKDIAGPRILEKTLAKLTELSKAGSPASGGGKFAMIVHLFEPHSTYMEHKGFPITERGTAALSQKYDYEIAVTDGQVGTILDALEASGLAKDTTVVLMSDHGEAFGVHSFAGEAMFFHGQTLYRELIHVPLMFRVPGVTPRMSSDVVQLIDLAPTLTELFGAKRPDSWIGRSLIPVLEGKPLEPRPAFSELLPAPDWDHDAKSMVSADGKRHVFFRISDSRWEIYDLENDPDEKKNLADSDPDAAKLKQQLAAWIEGPLAAGGSK